MNSKEQTTQQKIIEFIKDYRREHHFVPNQAVIARELKMTRQNVNYYFNLMEGELLTEFPEYKRYSFNQAKEKGTPNGKNSSAD
jgi:predicted transcriptional regulator